MPTHERCLTRPWLGVDRVAHHLSCLMQGILYFLHKGVEMNPPDRNARLSTNKIQSWIYRFKPPHKYTPLGGRILCGKKPFLMAERAPYRSNSGNIARCAGSSHGTRSARLCYGSINPPLQINGSFESERIFGSWVIDMKTALECDAQTQLQTMTGLGWVLYGRYFCAGSASPHDC